MLVPLRLAAAEEGFALCGIAPALEPSGFSNLVRWIESGYAGEMNYLGDRLDAYQHPAGVLAGARSLCMLAYPYDRKTSGVTSPGEGKVARYAWSGSDYHDIIHPKLKRLSATLRQIEPTATVRGVVDTAPLLEREFAELAGLGWRGKNTLLLNKHLGSYFFLACLITDVELPYDRPHRADHCGTCTACLEACPTDAFPQPGVLDATRCISYLTIEHRGHIARPLRAGIGDWLFGCDVCQEVCPWNTKPARRGWSSPRPLEQIGLLDLFAMDEQQFREQFRKTPLWRTRRRGILRNAAIVLGNQRHPAAIPVLVNALDEVEPVVRAAVVWALGRFDDPRCRKALQDRQSTEQDAVVREEIENAIAGQGGDGS